MFRQHIFLDKQTDFSPKRITVAVWLLGTLWMSDTELSGCQLPDSSVKLFLPHSPFSSAPSDMRHQKQEQKLFNHSDRALFLDGEMFHWFRISNLMFVSLLASGRFDEIEHEGLFCEIPDPFCRA